MGIISRRCFRGHVLKLGAVVEASGEARWGWLGRGGSAGEDTRACRVRRGGVGTCTARRGRIMASGHEEAIAMDVKEAVRTAKSYVAAGGVMQTTGSFSEVASA